MISYWKNPKEFYNDDGLVLIVGHYDGYLYIKVPKATSDLKVA